MKRYFQIFFILAFFLRPLSADNCQYLDAAIDEMNELHRVGPGNEDMIFNAISTSMIGWGVGLFAGIAVFTGFMYNSYEKSETSNNPSN